MWARNRNGNSDRSDRTLHNHIAIVNRLEPHTVRLVVADFVHIYSACAIRQVAHYHFLRYLNFLIAVAWHILVIDATIRVVRGIVDVEYAGAVVYISMVDRAWSVRAWSEVVVVIVRVWTIVARTIVAVVMVTPVVMTVLIIRVGSRAWTMVVAGFWCWTWASVAKSWSVVSWTRVESTSRAVVSRAVISWTWIESASWSFVSWARGRSSASRAVIPLCRCSSASWSVVPLCGCVV